jgi:hypothetical protein
MTNRSQSAVTRKPKMSTPKRRIAIVGKQTPSFLYPPSLNPLHLKKGGGGASGLATLRVLLSKPEVKETKLWSITAYESRDDIGGIWLPDKDYDPSAIEHISSSKLDDPIPQTPLYDCLTTNLPHPLMWFHNFPFPRETPLFPPASTVLEYLRDYARNFGLREYIKFNASVVDLSWEGNSHEGIWVVRDSNGEIEHYDLVILCNGHYTLPRIPSSIPGLLDKWPSRSNDERKVIHSVYYRNPTPFDGKKVLVMGGGPSGNDLTSDLSTVASLVVQSIPGSSNRDGGGNVMIRGGVIRCEESGDIIFEDGGVEKGIERILLATGYQYSFPFLSSSILRPSPPPPPPLDPSIPAHTYLYNSTSHVYPLARHIFPLQNSFPPTSLAFVGLLSKLSPFPVFELQAQLVASTLSNPMLFEMEKEVGLVNERYALLRSLIDGTLTDEREITERIWKLWHRMIESRSEQFTHRRELIEYAGVKDKGWEVESWMEKVYPYKGVLRNKWVEIERLGPTEVNDWVEGVESVEGWLEVMRRLLGRAGVEADF